MERNTAIGLAANLTAFNWAVEGADQGGELVKEGPSQNEVRFFHAEDQEAAVTLARNLYDLSPDTTVAVRDFIRLCRYVPNGQLEIWVNHVTDQQPPVN